ncbi:MAG TPA: hypothetical protein VEB22_05235, partial [Phycisphaerales bacterium]|nr:hypothetical protein [Phycisphaerales bacterium]
MSTRLLTASLLHAAVVALCASAALSQVRLSGYIADSYTTFAPFGNTLGQYNVTVSQGQHGVDFHSFPQGQPVFPSRHASAVSGGGPGFVTGYGFAQYISNVSSSDPGSYYIRSEAAAIATWTDVVVSPTGGGGPSTVPFSVNFVLTGSFNFNTSNVVDPQNVGWSQFSSASFSITVHGAGQGGNWVVRSDNGGPVINPLANGFFTNFDGSVEGTTDPVVVPVNTPFTIEMVLLINAQVQVPHGASISTSTTTDFAHTASFATTGPAFNLPPGYTANSAQAGVANNSYTLPPAACPGDLGTTGGLPGRDGVRDNNDFVVFIDYFFA